MSYVIRNFGPADATAVNAVALSAFAEYHRAYSDWGDFARTVGDMALLAETGKLIVATVGRDVVGAVAYVGPGRPKREFFDPEWPILRMLVTEPACRGRGIGRALTQACIELARRDGAPLIALHTSPIMHVALTLYERMGFVREREAPAILGVPYGVYVRRFPTYVRAAGE